MAEHVLVTGGAGFIGTVLINHLNEHNYLTSSIDHNDQHAVTGFSAMRDLLTPSCFEIELERIHQKEPIHRVIHLAAQVGRIRGEDDVRYTIRENAEMTTMVARTCGAKKIPLVYASTSEIYGDQDSRICHEDRGPFGLPHNLYGLSKRWGEETCHLYAPRNLVIWRPSMPYGPGAPPGRGRRAMDNFLWQAHHHVPIAVHRGSERSWCWIDDTVEAMRLTIKKAATSRSLRPQAYNIGRDDDPRSMLEIAKMACDLAGAPHSLIHEVEPPDNQTKVKRLSTKKVRDLGWKPKIDLEVGIKQVYEWVSLFDLDGKKIA